MVTIKRSADLAAVALSSSKIATLYKRSVAPRYWEIIRILRSLRRSNQRNFLAFYQLRVGYYERPPSPPRQPRWPSRRPAVTPAWRVSAARAVPIAAGENAAGVHDFHAQFEAGSIDVAQPSVIKIGVPSAMLEIAALAKAFGVRVLPHSAYFGPASWPRCMSTRPSRQMHRSSGCSSILRPARCTTWWRRRTAGDSAGRPSSRS
jgi:hypothetical protein